jgi:hypothetical protein
VDYVRGLRNWNNGYVVFDWVWLFDRCDDIRTIGRNVFKGLPETSRNFWDGGGLDFKRERVTASSENKVYFRSRACSIE